MIAAFVVAVVVVIAVAVLFARGEAARILEMTDEG